MLFLISLVIGLIFGCVFLGLVLLMDRSLNKNGKTDFKNLFNSHVKTTEDLKDLPSFSLITSH